MKETIVFYGNRLTLLRMFYQMSMMDLAKKTGLSKQAISRFENGQLKPSVITTAGLANIFNMPSGYFTDEVVSIKIIGSKIKLQK